MSYANVAVLLIRQRVVAGGAGRRAGRRHGVGRRWRAEEMGKLSSRHTIAMPLEYRHLKRKTFRRMASAPAAAIGGVAAMVKPWRVNSRGRQRNDIGSIDVANSGGR